MRKKNKPDFVKLLNYNLSYNPIFESLYKSTSKILDEQIGEPLSQLARIRSSQHVKRGDYLDVETTNGVQRGRVADVKIIQEDDGSHYAKITLGLGNGTAIVAYKEVLQDRKTLINQAALSGIDYYSDYISDVEYARLVDYANVYWKYQNSGERDFINFIGFIKGMRLSLIQLWTKDQGDFANNQDVGFDFYEYLKPEEDIVDPVKIVNNTAVGTEYLTSHVDMEYDVLASPNVLFNDLINLFYYFAPIELVLNRIIGAMEVEIETNGTIVPQIDSNLLSRYAWEPKTTLESKYTSPIPQIDSNLNSYLFIDNYYEEIDPDYKPYEHDWELNNRYLFRYIDFNSVSKFKSLSTIWSKSDFNGISVYTSKPDKAYSRSEFIGSSNFESHPTKSIFISSSYDSLSVYSSDRTVAFNRISNYEELTEFTSKYYLDILINSEFTGISSFIAIPDGAFDEDAFDDGFR